MFRLLFRSDWRVPAIFAVVCFALSVAVYFGSLKTEADKKLAREAGQPAIVSLNDFNPKRDIHPADEVHVQGWTEPAHNYALEMEHKSKRSSWTETRRLMMIFGPEDQKGAKVVRAAILLDESQAEQFITESLSKVRLGAQGQILLDISGTAENSPSLKSMAEDAIKKEGMSKAPGFIFIESWGSKGRDAALAADPDSGPEIALFFGGVGVILLLAAVYRFRNPPKVGAPVSAKPAALLADVPLVDGASVAPLIAARKPSFFKAVLILGGAGVALALIYSGALGLVLPFLMLGIFLLGLRSAKKGIAGGLTGVFSPSIGARMMSGPQKPLSFADDVLHPAPAAQHAASAAPAFHSGPIQSSPGLRDRLILALTGGRLIRWVPFGLGVAFLALSGKLMPMLSGNLGGPVQLVALAEPEIVGPATSGLPAGTFLIAPVILVLALLAGALYHFAKGYATSRGVPQNDPWDRIARQKAANRARS